MSLRTFSFKVYAETNLLYKERKGNIYDESPDVVYTLEK